MLFAEICFSQENEKFDTDFILTFFSDKDFQHERLNDTVTFLKFNMDDFKIDTFSILKHKWTFDSIYLFGKVYTEVYDKFDRKYYCQSNERVFEIKEYGTGFMIYYYFKRERGLWYLIRKEDFSN